MWVTRDDKNGTLTLWVNEYPKRKNGIWIVLEEDDYEYWGIPIDKNLFPNLTWDDEPLEVSLVPNKIDKGYKERKKSVKKSIKEYTAEEIYYFENGANPDYDEWVKAGIELEYGETEDDFEYNDYRMNRGDFDYTRN